MLVGVADVGVNTAPPNVTSAPGSKPVPVIVRVKFGDCAGVTGGDSDVIVGGTACVTRNNKRGDVELPAPVPPTPGFVTVTGTSPVCWSK